MRSFLLRKEDYDRLLNMGPQEIFRYLQESSYQPDFQGVDVPQNISAIEAAFNKHLLRTFQKLVRISPASLQEVLKIYLQRYDLENIKLILRSKVAGIPSSEVRSLLYPSVHHPASYWDELLLLQRPEEIIQAAIQAVPSLRQFQNTAISSLTSVENELDGGYVQELRKLAASLSGQPLALLLQQEIDIIHIQILIRLRAIHPSADVHSSIPEPSHFVQRLMSKQSLPEMVSLLHHHHYTTLQGSEEDVIEQLEVQLPAALLRRQTLLMHQRLLSPNFIMGYFFAKDVEVRNLKALLKGKQLGLAKEKLEHFLVVAS